MTGLYRKNGLLMAALSSAVVIGNAGSTSAAPVLTNTAAVKSAFSSEFVEIRHNNAGAFFGGLVVGGILGATIARPYYYSYPYYGYYAPYPSPYPYYAYRPYYYGYAYPAYRYYPRHYRYRRRH